MRQTVYNPGCALLLYKPEYVDRILHFLNTSYAATSVHTECCRHEPKLIAEACVINTCAGCNKRFSSLYEGISTISLWEILAQSSAFIFPDYSDLSVSVHDACPVRNSPGVHTAIRTLLNKMNITIVEAQYHGAESVCCGDSVYRAGKDMPIEKVHASMRQRAQSMPCTDVCVYCVSCIKSMHIGGKRPRYILDLLFGESTDPQIYDTAAWHKCLQSVIDTH